MARFEESSGLFGQPGGGTGGNIKCEWCGKNYTGRENKEGEAIFFDQFGRLQICDCCFGEVEAAVLSLMPRIIPWFIRILRRKRRQLTQYDVMIAELQRVLSRRPKLPEQ